MFKLDKISLKLKERVLFENFDLDLKRNDKVLVYGKSGTGKSTIISFFLGFLRPNSGKVLFNRMELYKKNLAEIRKNVVFIPQQSDLGNGIVNDLIKEIMSFKNNSIIKEYKTRLEELITFFELPEDVLSSDYQSLSGGEKQRISIVIGELINRNIYFLDEVTASLDAGMKQKVVDFYLSKKDTTLLVISHDQNWLESNKFKIVQLGD